MAEARNKETHHGRNAGAPRARRRHGGRHGSVVDHGGQLSVEVAAAVLAGDRRVLDFFRAEWTGLHGLTSAKRSSTSFSTRLAAPGLSFSSLAIFIRSNDSDDAIGGLLDLSESIFKILVLSGEFTNT